MALHFEKLTTSTILKLAALGSLLGMLPYALGIVLGFAAFVLTPIALPLASIFCGMSIGRRGDAAVWSGAIVVSAAAGAVNAILISGTVGVLAFVNRQPQQLLAVGPALLIALPAAALVLACISIGVLLARPRRPRQSA